MLNFLAVIKRSVSERKAVLELRQLKHELYDNLINIGRGEHNVEVVKKIIRIIDHISDKYKDEFEDLDSVTLYLCCYSRFKLFMLKIRALFSRESLDKLIKNVIFK